VYVASNLRSPAESREDISSTLPSAFADRAPESREILLRLRIEPATFRPPEEKKKRGYTVCSSGYAATDTS
jgi:hypothetical protein